MHTTKPPASFGLTPASASVPSSLSTLPAQMSFTADASHAREAATLALKEARLRIWKEGPETESENSTELRHFAFGICLTYESVSSASTSQVSPFTGLRTNIGILDFVLLTRRYSFARACLPMDTTDAQDTAVLPGEDASPFIRARLHPKCPAARLGAGLAAAVDGAPRPTLAGRLSFRAPDRFFVRSSARRYCPSVGDTVVGVVLDRAAQAAGTSDVSGGCGGSGGGGGAPELAYRVRLHATGLALLPHLAFDGASKRNKPALAVGALVFARVAAAGRHLDAELSCAALAGPRRDWTSGQALFGELRGGALARVSSGLARRLLDPRCALLAALGAAAPFELAVGLNGLVWVQAREPRHAAAVVAAIERAEGLGEVECEKLVGELVAAGGFG